MKILHLSDFYVDVNDSSCESFLSNFRDYITGITEDSSCDFIFISGDIALSGQAAEYELFEKAFLLPLKNKQAFARTQIFSTPGNHDLDCDIGLPIVWENLGLERQEKLFSDSPSGIKIRGSRAQAFECYQDFIKRNNISGLLPLEQVASGCTTGSPPHDIWIGTVNTALFSDKSVADHRKSVAPLSSVQQVVQNSGSNIKLLLGHHPSEWFTNDSARTFSDYLESESIVYIHGHSGGVKVSRSGGAICAIGVGSRKTISTHQEGVQRKYLSNCFGIYTIGRDSNDAKFFEFDRHTFSGNERSGNVEFSNATYVEKQDLDGSLDFFQKDSTGTLRPSLVENVKQRLDFDGCIWVSKDENKRWVKLLQDLDKVEEGDPETFSIERPVPVGHQYFRVKNGRGSYLIYTVKSHGDVLTFEQLQAINTEFERHDYYGCIVLSLGSLDDTAKVLASQLSAKKNFSVINYVDVCAKILKRFEKKSFEYLSGAKKFNCKLKLTIADTGYFALITEQPPENKYLLIDEAGVIAQETSELVRQLKYFNHLSPSSVYDHNIVASKSQLLHRKGNSFEINQYKTENFSYFNDVKYAPLAALGFKFENAQLQNIYINTSASIAATEASSHNLGRAISEMVESLDLSKNQRDQLESQLRTKVGLEGAPEAGMARQIYQKYNNILVLGDPGSGKTCFVKHELLSYCDPKSDLWYSKHLPVFVSLAEAANLLTPDIDILSICEQVSLRRGIALAETEIERHLREGTVAFFFDGLDEVGSIEKRIALVDKIDELVEKYALYGNRFVITSRPAAVQPVEISERLICLHLNGLSKSEMERLALSVLTLRLSDDGKAREVTIQDRQVVNRLIEDTNNSRGIARLASNPLLLTLLVLIYANAGAALSARRHLVYTQAIKTLVSVRAKETRAQKISEADLRRRLGAIAISVFSKNINEIPSRKQVQTVLDRVIRDKEIYAEPPTEASINAFIQEVAEATGLLSIHRQQGDDTQDLITFMHYSFLEYYAAAGLLSEDYEERIVSLADNPRWKDVITLLFGILSEHGDVTGAFKALTDSAHDDSSEEITNRRLLLAIECVSECEVAPEQTQILLANKLRATLSSGAARFSAGLREEIATKLDGFLPNSGDAISKMFVDGLSSNNPSIAAATCDLLSKVDKDHPLSQEIIESFKKSIDVNNPTFRASAVQMLEHRPEFRGDETIRVVERALKGSMVEKHAALKAVGAAPQYFYEKLGLSLVDLLDDNNQLIAKTAAQCLLATDVVLESTNLPAARIKVLNSLGSTEYDTGSVVMGVYAERSVVQRFLNSNDVRDVELGFRYMSLLKNEGAYIAETVLEIIKTRPDDDRVLSAGLDALRKCDGALDHLKVTHTDNILQLRQSNKRNVRIAAVRLLGELSADEEISNGLIAHMNQAAVSSSQKDEVSEAAQALANLAKKNISLRKSIVKIATDSIPQPPKGFGSDKNQRYIAGLLSVSEFMGEMFPPADARRLLSLAEDFRTPEHLRSAFMRTYGRVTEPNLLSIQNIIRLINGRNYKLYSPIYSSAKSVLSQCRRKVEYARAVYPLLNDFREALVFAWKREVENLRDSIESSSLRDIRLALKEIDYLQSSYSEFAQRRDATTLAE